MDPNMTVIQIAAMESFWKMVLIFITIPIFNKIPVPTTLCSSGVLENNLDGIYEAIHNGPKLI